MDLKDVVFMPPSVFVLFKILVNYEIYSDQVPIPICHIGFRTLVCLHFT